MKKRRRGAWKKGTERKLVSPSFFLSVSISFGSLAAHVNLAANDIHDETGKRLPQIGDRQFDSFVDRAFEEARAVSGAESLLNQAIDGGFGDNHAFALARHLTLNGGQIELGDLLDFVLSQRRENHDLIDAVAEFG